MSKRFILSEDQERYLREHYPTDTLGDIADYFGVSPGVVARIVREMGLKKAAGWSPNKYYGRYTHKRAVTA